MVPCSEAGKQDSHLPSSEDSVGCQLPLPIGRSPYRDAWFPGAVGSFALTPSITKGPADGKLCSCRPH